MSAYGTKRTSNCRSAMSAFGGKADIDRKRSVTGGNNQLAGSNLSAKIAFYQFAVINCTPLKPLPLNQASQKAINAKPRPSPAAAAKA